MLIKAISILRSRDTTTARLGLGNAVVDHDFPYPLRHGRGAYGVLVKVVISVVYFTFVCFVLLRNCIQSLGRLVTNKKLVP